jgi:hypothetical protein
VAPALIEAANAGRTVLVPNTELAAALFDAIERAHRDAGRDLWPTPRVRDIGGWLKEHHVQRQLTDSSTPRCLSDVEERELWRSVVLESDSSRQFLEPSGAARAARRAHRAMLEYGIPVSAVAAYRTEESLALLEWNRRFTERCRLLHCISSAQLPPSAPVEAIAWIDSPQWRPVARRWLQENAGAPLPPMSAVPHGLLRSHQAESPGAELAAMARWGEIHLRDNPRFRAWICVPDLPLRREEVVDAFDAALAPQRFSLSDPQAGAPYAVAGGTPLADYAPVRCALALLSAGSGPVTFEQFSALLRLPELQAEPADASAAARLDVALRSRAPSEANLERWLTLADEVARVQSIGPVAALLRLQSAARALDELRGNQPISRWVSLWITAFEAGPWALRHRWSSSEYQSAERFRELLAGRGGGAGVRRSVVRRSLAPVRGENSAARRPRYGISDTDRHPPDLGERTIARPMAFLRWAVDHWMQRGALAAAARPDSSAAHPAAEAVWSDRRGSAVAIAVRRGVAAALAGSRPRVRLQLRRCRRWPARCAEPAVAAGRELLAAGVLGRTAASLARAPKFGPGARGIRR